MTKHLFIILLCCMAITACKKNSTQPVVNNPQPAPDTGAMNYTLTGQKDISMQWADSATLELGIGYINGKKEDLQLRAESMPPGMTVSFSRSFNIPPFTSTMTVYTRYVQQGVYPVKIIALTANRTTTHAAVVTVAAPPPLGCAPELAGTYNNTGSGRNPVAETTVVTVVDRDRIYFDDLVFDMPFKIAAVADLNCNSGTFTIPQGQASGGFEYKGMGTFQKDRITVKIEYHDLGSPLKGTIVRFLNRK